ncbi:MAG: acyl-CoA dehydrogenase family protein [Deltaproteobacteria bacterium]|nr:acyl-CoA dehydrogenase family protein [Deltaproteobacteria bacterium]
MSHSLEDSLARVTAIAAAHALAVDRDASFPTHTIDALRAEGLLGLISSTDVGGLGRGMDAALTAVDHLARACGSSAMVLCMHYAGTIVIEQFGPLDVRKEIAAGKHVTTLAFSEASSRSHFWAPTSTARIDGEHIVLDAHKSWITSASHADSYVWSSKPTEGSELSSLWLAPAKSQGIHVKTAGFDGLGFRGNNSCPVMADGVKLSAASTLGGDGKGFGVMMGTVLPWFSVMNAACSLGLMESVITATAAHAGKTRFEHINESLANLPTIRAYIARMRNTADMTRTLVQDTVAACTAAREDAMLRVLQSKSVAAESAVAVTELAMRVCGGAAFRKELGIERAFRDARASMVMGPTTDVLYDFIGKAVCGLPLF